MTGRSSRPVASHVRGNDGVGMPAIFIAMTGGVGIAGAIGMTLGEASSDYSMSKGAGRRGPPGSLFPLSLATRGENP